MEWTIVFVIGVVLFLLAVFVVKDGFMNRVCVAFGILFIIIGFWSPILIEVVKWFENWSR